MGPLQMPAVEYRAYYMGKATELKQINAEWCSARLPAEHHRSDFGFHRLPSQVHWQENAEKNPYAVDPAQAD
jgi:hypothetical protein